MTQHWSTYGPRGLLAQTHAPITGAATHEKDVVEAEVVLNDHLGSPRLRLGSSRQVEMGGEDRDLGLLGITTSWMPKNPMDYTPFGRELALSSDSKTTPDSYTGKPLDTTFGLQAMNYGARFYDPRLGRWWQRDPLAEKNTDLSPYQYADNNPIMKYDPDGRDAEVTITGNTITINARIYAYGDGATQEWIVATESAINMQWNNGGRGWEYVDSATKIVYEIQINCTIEKFEGSRADVFFAEMNPLSRDNYVEMWKDEASMSAHTWNGKAISYVDKGDEGVWRAYGVNPGPHEFGHFLGLKDRYHKVGNDKVPNLGWIGNMMAARTGEGNVDMHNIFRIISPILNDYNNAGRPQTYATDIDEDQSR